MQIPRHPIDADFLANLPDRAKMSLDSLARLTAATRKNVESLGVLANAGLFAAAISSLLDPKSEQVVQAFQLARQALNALFSCSLDPTVAVTVGAGEPVIYAQKPDASSVCVGNWLDAFYLNLIFGDLPAVKRLCDFPTVLLQQSPTIASEYRYLYKDALCSYVNGDEDVIDRIISAMKATDPNRPDIYDRHMVLKVGVPQVELFYRAVTHDSKFGPAMQVAVQRHREYWSEQPTSVRGFVSIALLGIVVLGLDVGLQINVDSPYLPMHLIRTI